LYNLGLVSQNRRVRTIDIGDDVVLLTTALSAHFHARVRDALAAAGHPDLRDSHGYVFQHLIGGPAAIGVLAAALGMTQQGASKAVIELERLGYVVRRDHEPDRRQRRVELTDRGVDAVEAARRIRAAITVDARERLGPAGAAFVRSLRALAEDTGAAADLTGRRLRPAR
jgi:DNA-binding MarR family transcriptional regulator